MFMKDSKKVLIAMGNRWRLFKSKYFIDTYTEVISFFNNSV